MDEKDIIGMPNDENGAPKDNGLAEAEPVADEVTESAPVADEVSEGEPVADELPESEPIAEHMPDGDEVLPIADITEIDSAAKRPVPKHDRKKAPRGAGNSADKPKWKKIVGALLALIPAILCIVIIAISTHMNGISFGGGMSTLTRNLLLISFALLSVSTVLGVLRPRLPKWFAWVGFAIAPAGVMLLSEWIIRDPFGGKMTWQVILLNIAIYYITAAFFLFITRNTFVAIVAASWFPLALGAANHYLLLFRGTVLFPWDLQSIGIAMTVVDNYEFDFPVVLSFVIICFIVMWQLAYFSRVKILRSAKKMIVSFVCALLCLAMGVGYGAYMRTEDVLDRFSLYPYLFTPNTVYYRDGMMVSVLFSLKFMGVDKPDGYSEDEVAALAAEYADAGENAASTEKQPNIIVIMNEAWSDISVLAPFETNTEVFPVTSQLKENVIRGQMYMSVNGGNTANSEFEFLTSSSMAFLPPGSVPYQLFIKHETPTLVASLEEQGYQTVAMHPYLAGGWDRDKVYPYFGFDASYFNDSFPDNAKKIRSYISDEAMFDKIEELYEARDEEKPFFLFGVSMQNHGGYTGHFDNFEQTVSVKGLESRSSLSQYLSLIRETDYAFGDLISYFSSVDEPTIILMFGDHQPGEFVTAPLYANAGKTYPPESFEEQQDKFIVPFIMWANYDVDERDDVLTSANYLSILVCETAGLELTPYQKFLRELEKDYPVVTANFYIDKEGEFHSNDEMKAVEAFNKYKIIQYNQIIDYKNRAEKMYTTK